MRTSTSPGLRRLAGGALLTALAILASALPSPAQTAKPQTGLRLTYLMYSGRPNPTVTVTEPKQVAEIERRLAGTLAAGRTDGAAPSPVLGYNGIRIDRLDAPRGEGWIVVRSDTMWIEGGEVRKVAGAKGELRSLASFSRSTVAVSREAAEIEGLLISLGADSGAVDPAALAEARVSR